MIEHIPTVKERETKIRECFKNNDIETLIEYINSWIKQGFDVGYDESKIGGLWSQGYRNLLW